MLTVHSLGCPLGAQKVHPLISRYVLDSRTPLSNDHSKVQPSRFKIDITVLPSYEIPSARNAKAG